MKGVAPEQELYKACQVIFGSDLHVTRQFLEYVQLSGVKSAYRKRAKETHPDLLAGQGEFVQRRGARQFQSVKEAYENLKLYVAAREKGFRFVSRSPQQAAPSAKTRHQAAASARQRASQQARWAAWQRRREEALRRQAAMARAAARAHERRQRQQAAGQAKKKAANLFDGTVPQRPMLFGHFLYYSGLIDWHTLVKALIWQRANRPRVGEIGQRFGWLTASDITHILQRKQARDMFGKAAVAGGKLTTSQLRMILSFQKKQQKRIGEYFVRHRIFSRRKLAELLHLFQSHNANYSGCRRKAC